MKVLVTATNYSKYCQAGKKLLEEAGCEIIENPYGHPYEPEELRQTVRDIDGAVIGVDTWDETVFQSAKKLKGVARFGVGVDNIDLKAAKKHGVKVCNSPGINSSAVAEHAAALIFSLMREIPQMNSSIREGEWERPMFHELKGRTLGFLGFGAIARKVAKKLKSFEPHMIAYDKFPNEQAAGKLGVEMMGLEEVFRRADIISIHLPATKETEHLISARTISLMKDGVLIINTARGCIVEEKDMENALKCKKVGGFASDVFESEPIRKDYPLFQFPNYIATPHVAAETYENCEQTSIVTARALLDIFDHKEPENRLV